MDQQSARYPHAPFPAGARETRFPNAWGQRVHPAFKAPLLYYCGADDPSWGARIVRSALAQGLSTQFRVTVVGDFAAGPDSELPASIKVVRLPQLGSVESEAERRRILTTTFAAVNPQVMVVDQFPFGDLDLASEILHLLEMATATDDRPFIASSVRDLPGSRGVPSVDADVARSLADQYFDVVLVHADPNIARLEDAFVPDAGWSVPVRYTGFISVDPRGPADVPHERLSEGGEIVVFGEGGGPRDRLCQIALEAADYLSSADRLPMRIVTGSGIGAAEFRALEEAAAGIAGVTLQRSAPDLRELLAGAAITVSHCAYRTVLDLVRSRVPALVVPTVGGGGEQTARARRLAALGVVRVVEPDWLDGPTLGCEIASTIGFAPLRLALDLSGARATVKFLARMTESSDVFAASIPDTESA